MSVHSRGQAIVGEPVDIEKRGRFGIGASPSLGKSVEF
jgi:hypothetical protein